MYIKIFRNRIIAAGIVWVCICSLPACVKTTNTVPVVNSSSTIAAIVRNATNLTVLDSILKITGQLSLLDSKDTVYTLFAPPDIAFGAVGLYDSTLYKDSIGYFTRLVRYHLLAGYAKTAALLAADLAGPNAPYLSASGDTLFFTVNGNGIFVNGNPLTQTDVMASNGVIHAISRVLLPPNGSIWRTLSYDSALYNDSTFTYLVAALNRASTTMTMGSPILDTLLSSGGIFTIFAPSNNAFRADSIFATIDAINAADPDSLVRLLTRHIVAGRVFSSDFSQTSPLPTLLAGDSINFALTYGITIMQKDSINFANVSVTNILATNGVIHKIEQVLTP